MLVLATFWLVDDEVGDATGQIAVISAATFFHHVDDVLALFGLHKAGRADQECSAGFGCAVDQVGFAAARLERLQFPFLLEGNEVDVGVLDPELAYGFDPAGGHGLDVGTLLCDMAVLGGIVVADDEVSTIGGEVVFVLAAEFVGFAGNVILLIQRLSWLSRLMGEEEGEAGGISSGTVPLVLERRWCSTRRRP